MTAKPKRKRASKKISSMSTVGGNYSGWQILTDGSSATGVNVSKETALKTSAVYGCVHVISETIASLPLMVYRRLPGGGKERATDHYLYKILHDQPNSWQTSFQWREMGTTWLCLQGNWYCKINTENGTPTGLVPIRSDRVTPEWLTDGTIRYKILNNNGQTSWIAQQNMLHVANLGLDGLTGLSPISLATESIAQSIAIMNYGSKMFTSGGSKRVALKSVKPLNEKGIENLRTGWDAVYGGAGNVGKTAVLEDGTDAVVIGMSLDDAQRVESAQFSVEDIARWYRMPLHKIGHLLRATFSNIEHQGIEFVTDTILPWCRRIESAIQRDLIYEDDIFVEFLLDGLLRGDSAARAAYYTSLFNIGALTINEICEMENRNTIGNDGDKRYVPMNMQELGKEPEPQPQIVTTTNEPDEEQEAAALDVFINDIAERLAHACQRNTGKDKIKEYAVLALSPVLQIWNMRHGTFDRNLYDFNSQSSDEWKMAIRNSLQ